MDEKKTLTEKEQTELWNKTRCGVWGEELTKQDARITVMLGEKNNGYPSFIADPNMSMTQVADFLEKVAQALRAKNKHAS